MNLGSNFCNALAYLTTTKYEFTKKSVSNLEDSEMIFIKYHNGSELFLKMFLFGFVSSHFLGFRSFLQYTHMLVFFTHLDYKHTCMYLMSSLFNMLPTHTLPYK